ncbi:hypothetical protein P154DRAFT_448000 [Amniculicola lignicola CBS 123094]|uniref:DUF7730 domain-containing protein n=1 Tax=Amniculicola lignicola CBS 123094 TaxID=1392246 RepID=A0A6A5W009_9PLEO|nr:hypothetical protein P154DRAFT_448000 [Amniculicola lignicola CBS 123094]
MVPNLTSSNSTAFLALPLEIRQQIYRFCIPENLCFICSGHMYHQNRPECWVEPRWRWDRTSDRYDAEENDCLHYVWESVEVSSTDGENSDEEDEYEPCKLDDYSQDSRRYLPRISSSHRSALPGLLLVCRQITDEVTGMLYGRNTFRVKVDGDGQLNLLRLFSSETREKMRRMILVLRPMGVSYGPSFCMDPKVWDGVLGSLSVIGFIVEQPSPYASPRVGPEDVFEKWTAWLTPILEYLGRALPRTAQIVVDANKGEDTVHIVENAMPGRCHFQRLRAADSIFRRGEFSLESGYWDDDGPTSCRDIINECDYDCYYSD